MCFLFEVTAAASIVLQLTSQRQQGSQRDCNIFFNFLNLSSKQTSSPTLFWRQRLRQMIVIENYIPKRKVKIRCVISVQ